MRDEVLLDALRLKNFATSSCVAGCDGGVGATGGVGTAGFDGGGRRELGVLDFGGGGGARDDSGGAGFERGGGVGAAGFAVGAATCSIRAITRRRTSLTASVLASLSRIAHMYFSVRWFANRLRNSDVAF